MIASYWIAFGRIVIGLTFVLSLIGELQDITSFSEAITRFKILPKRSSNTFAYLLLSGEIAVITSMLVGGPLLFGGFLLSGVMFLTFSIALASVVFRKIETSCHCFGPSDEKKVGPFHIVRAAGLMALAGGSCCTLLDLKESMTSLDLWNWGLMGMGGAAFVMIWVQLSEIVELFKTRSI